jgi:hypothetical protein
MSETRPPTNYVNLLPPGGKTTDLYCVIDVINPAADSYKVASPAVTSYYLHLPKELNNVFSMNWEQKELGGDILSAIVMGGTAGGGAGADSGAIAASDLLYGAIDAAAGVGIGSGALEGAKALAGKARNPVNTLIFQNANLRNFQFSWDLIPLDKQISKQYEAMIKDLRYRMHPRLDSNTFFLSPFSFRVKIWVKNKYLIHTAPCAMTNLTINAFGQGVPAFHEDGTPVHTVLTIELQELVQQTQQSISYLYNGPSA